MKNNIFSTTNNSTKPINSARKIGNGIRCNLKNNIIVATNIKLKNRKTWYFWEYLIDVKRDANAKAYKYKLSSNKWYFVWIVTMPTIDINNNTKPK